MLREICFLSVRFATVLTDVRLEMLRFFVLRDVLEQSSFVSEALVACVTLIWFISCMAPGVRLKVGELRKCLDTSHIAALVRLVTRVRSDMLLQVRKLGELALANFATIWFDSQVYSCMLRQVA